MPDAEGAEETPDEARQLDADVADLIRGLGSDDPVERDQALRDLKHLLPIMQHLTEERLRQHQHDEDDQ